MSEEKPDRGEETYITKGAEAEIPAGLRRVHRQLEQSRSTRRGRSPLPEALRIAAAEAAREHGKLKRVMNAKAAKTSARTAFVELAPLSAMGGDECVLELEAKRGKLRLRLRGRTAEDLAGLSRAL